MASHDVIEHSDHFIGRRVDLAEIVLDLLPERMEGLIVDTKLEETQVTSPVSDVTPEVAFRE
jgi:hypothetical protein